jgi:WD40 repeat protein
VPRPERPLDHEDSALGQFAADLRGLREMAGAPSYRELSRIAHYSATVLSEAAGGRKLPSLAVALAYVRACAGDVDKWRQRWHEVAAGLTDPSPAAQPPYVGLATFQSADADRFFGRDGLLEDLRGRLEQRRLVGLFGASGAGKSSLLRAGLVASNLDRPTMVFTPGPRPREECALRLAELVGKEAPALLAELAADPATLHLYLRQAATRGGADVLVVVDQFEEIFTQCAGQDERDWLVAALVHAATAPTSQTRVVLGVRADFYGHCGNYPELVEALRDAQVLVGAMTTDELRQVISGPAARAGFAVETALVSTLVAEATGQPAVLPLVSHALLETWRHRRGARLTLAGYEETGGLQHAIARTAESVCDALDPGQLAAARRLFLRLTAVVDGAEDTKRRLRRRELDASDADTATVVERFADARLLTLDADTVQLSHEAIIRCWPRLREWLQDDREGRRLHRHLTEATESWESLGEDAGGLYRSTRLARVRDWVAANPMALTSRERRFLDASLTTEAAEHADARRRTRRLRQLVAGLTALLLVAVVAVGFAVNADQTATAQRDLALARHAVDSAASVHPTDPALSVQLDLAAYQLAPNSETRNALLSAFGTPYGTLLTGHTSIVTSLAFSADSHVLATASRDRTVRLWRVDDPHQPRTAGTIALSSDTGPVVAFGRGGHILAAADGDAVALWDVGDPDHPRKLSAPDSHQGITYSLAFSADGSVLATGTAGHKATLWDVRDPAAPRLLTSAIGSDGIVAISADGRLLAVSDGPTGARLWNVGDPTAPKPLGALVGHRDVVAALAFSPDGRTLASGSWDHDVRLWDIGDPAAPRPLATLTGSTAIVWSLAFSPDGRTLASTGSGTRLWDVTDPQRAAGILTLPAGVMSAAFSPDGTALATTTGNHNAIVYDLSDLPLAGHHNTISAMAYSRDGRMLATGSWDDTVRLWDLTASGQRRALATLAGQTAFVRAIALSPDGRLLAAASDDGTVWLWDIADPRNPVHRGTVRHAAGREILSVAFTPDGRTMATAGVGTVQLWDIADPVNPVPGSRLPGYSDEAWVVVISPDGRTMVVSTDTSSRLWDISDTARPREIPFRYGSTDTVQPNAFSPDGRLLATVSAERTVRLLDMSDPGRPRQLATSTGYGDVVYSAVFSADGRRLATGDGDGTIQLLDIGDPRDPRELGVFSNPPGDGVVRVAFSPDGRTIAGGGLGGGVRLWPTDIDQAIARVCAVAHPPITEAEWGQYLPGVPYRPLC